MKTLKFKTNIKCSGCVAKVKPYLDKLEKATWDVDVSVPEKVLTVKGDINEKEVQDMVSKAGFNSEISE
ncbi:MAG: heavy-metal-associated domain-containing protein [Cytophagaceae bacterium]